MSQRRTTCRLTKIIHDTHSAFFIAHNARSVVSRRRLYASINPARLSFGQPLHETHPHLLGAGELTSGITALEYAQRRSKLATKLPDKAVAIVAASDTKYRAGNVFYEFHQDPDFFYLTGFNEPEALAVIAKTESNDDHTFHLYVREKDHRSEKWEGARSGTQAAIDVFNADETGDISRLKDLLPRIISDASQVYTDITLPNETTSWLSRFLRGSPPKAEGFAKMIDLKKTKMLRPVMNDLRVFKSAAEIQNMRIAGKASGRAFTEAMKHPWTKEKELHAFMEYQIKSEGCETLAFEPVVAGGVNGHSIHYVRNNDVLHDGDLVMVDAGGMYGGYITDITRVWPVNGKYSQPQRDLYEAVLEVQRTCIALCRESAQMTLDKLHDIAEHSLRDTLKQLGFDMSGNAIELLFPHHLSHYIGLEVHDSAGYSRRAILRTGQCVTIEPGIYVPFDDRWPKHFQGLGARVEDSVCVQDDSAYVFTTEAVKEVVDIEALRA